ncbi:MAG: protein-glutamate O-methyltransferase CheR [Candidatus Eremiobacteraeota bacterium]|nr:protein-glutamate O-methyltransferase CheR [Candidatus Eremiobacteraeota bacterium]
MSIVLISESEFTALRDLIRTRFGIYYDDSKQFLLQSRLQARLIKCRVADFTAYIRFLTVAPERETEITELASVLSNNETYFFREHAQLDILAGEVVDDALRSAGGRLRVWSSACSTGEEPFTLAMTLLDGRRISPGQITIKASDISPRALEKSAAGYYRELSFRATKPEMISRYFKPLGDGFAISDEIKRMVTFFRLNLLDAQAIAGVGKMDAIFCRNVLIYFDKPTQKKVVEGFARALRPGGYLFLGHAESIMRLTDLYAPVISAKAIYYRLKSNAD